MEKQKVKSGRLDTLTSCNPILIKRVRGEVVESFHRGVICVVDKNGKILFSVGDINQICYPRSALKFFQQIPLIESGAAQKFRLTEKEIAITCGSHNAEDIHVAAVLSILKKAGLTEDDLRCGAHFPFDEETKNKLIQNGASVRPIHNNCSGKHAGFLLLAKYLGCSTENYLDFEHPVQKQIKQVVSEMHECEGVELRVARDGCSAPMYGLSILAQATGYKNLCYPNQFGKKRQAVCRKIVTSALNYPEMLAGKKRYCTEMIKATAGKVLGKTGAEGVYSLAFLDPRIGCTIKIDDGTSSMQYHTAQAILEQSGLFDAKHFLKLTILQERTIRNWNGQVTGKIEVNENVFRMLKPFVALS